MEVVRQVDTQMARQQDTVVLVQDHQVSRVVLQPQSIKYLDLSNMLVVEEVSRHDNPKTNTK